ncbi:amidohydrolase family protein [Streptomyces sp. NPDC051018]|uniref:amidohydrolase family protein n=1 Tax=Streptomyces sp. NPDC051018 TaxID=3365639 RepID=UPI00379FA765
MTRIVFRGGQVFDGTGSAPVRADVAVENGVFTDVGSDLRGDQVVDVTGRTLLPGMFDCHVHILGVEMAVKSRLNEPFSYQFYNAKRNLERTLACGITTIRDCAGADLGVKRALEDGLIPGPRLLISVTALSQTGGHMDGWTPSSLWVDPYYVAHPGRPSSICDGVDGVRKAARQSLRAGADFLKVLATHSGGASYLRTRFSREELNAIGDEARTSQVGFAVHAYGSQAVKDSVAAGATTIEHVRDLDDEAIAAMREADTALVPTIAPLLKYLGDDRPDEPERDRLGHQGDPNNSKTEFAREAYDSVRRAHGAGVRIAMGTDYGNDAGQNLDELTALVAAGLTPAETLVAATSGSARAVGLHDELGTIEPGKRADVVVVDGDIFDFSKLKQNIESVHMDGRLVHSRTR